MITCMSFTQFLIFTSAPVARAFPPQPPGEDLVILGRSHALIRILRGLRPVTGALAIVVVSQFVYRQIITSPSPLIPKHLPMT